MMIKPLGFAMEPEDTKRACLTPNFLAKACSNSSVLGPIVWRSAVANMWNRFSSSLPQVLALIGYFKTAP